jgi:hypothetical protein
MMRTFLLAAIFLVPASQLSVAEELVWRTEAELAGPVEISQCDPKAEENCDHFVAYSERSKFGVNQYMTYVEATRATIGFGTNEHRTWQGATVQLHNGAYDWGGIVKDGKFKPLYVIKRFYSYDWTDELVSDDHTHLVVFRLLDDGTSCIVDQKPNDTADNAVARARAEKDFLNPSCSK